MEQIEQAYRKLGLTPYATKEEVDDRYESLLKKERAKIKRGESTLDNQEFAEITKAYREILDYETKKYTEAFEAQEYGKYKGMADKAKKIDHFWRYYKVHTFTVIAIIAIVIYGVVAYMDKQEQKRYEASLPPIDLRISFLGEFFDVTNSNMEMQATEDKLLADFNEYQRIETDIIYVPTDPSMQATYLQKAMALIMVEKPDLYIMDEPMAQWATNTDMFVPLDDIPELAHLMESKYAKTTVNQDTNETYTYGIELNETSLSQDLQVAYPTLITGIRLDAPNKEKALDFIIKYASEIE